MAGMRITRRDVASGRIPGRRKRRRQGAAGRDSGLSARRRATQLALRRVVRRTDPVVGGKPTEGLPPGRLGIHGLADFGMAGHAAAPLAHPGLKPGAERGACACRGAMRRAVITDVGSDPAADRPISCQPTGVGRHVSSAGVAVQAQPRSAMVETRGPSPLPAAAPARAAASLPAATHSPGFCSSYPGGPRRYSAAPSSISPPRRARSSKMRPKTAWRPAALAR